MENNLNFLCASSTAHKRDLETDKLTNILSQACYSCSCQSSYMKVLNAFWSMLGHILLHIATGYHGIKYAISVPQNGRLRGILLPSLRIWYTALYEKILCSNFSYLSRYGIFQHSKKITGVQDRKILLHREK